MLSKEELLEWMRNGSKQSKSPYDAAEHFEIDIEEVYKILHEG